MKRAMLGLATVAVAGVMSASPALAFNSGTPPGPPLFSYGPVNPFGPIDASAVVFHCQVFGGSSVVVVNQNGIQGNCPI